jgi:hypothetical protein
MQLICAPALLLRCTQRALPSALLQACSQHNSSAAPPAAGVPRLHAAD